MNFTGQDEKINGTPSVNNRDASRQIGDDATEHGLDDAAQGEKQWASRGRTSNRPLMDEKNYQTDQEDDSISSSSSDQVEQGNVHGRPSIGSRVQTGRSMAAGQYANPYIPELDVERQDPPSRSRSASKAPTLSLDMHEAVGPSPSRVSTDAHGNNYPEGGLDAYLCVFGSFSGLMAALGIMNTIGTYQAYLSTHQLSHISTGAIGWIFGMYSFLSFFLGIQIGPLFDAYGPRALVFIGSVLITAAQLLLGQCTQYWHFMLNFGVLGGIGTSLIFTPAISAVGHWFLRRRGQFVGLAATGGSLGGVVFPLALQRLLPEIGFAWSCRVIALCNLVLLVFANLFIRSRLPRNTRIRLADILPDFTVFRDITFSFTTAAVFFTEWALFIPLSYCSSYAIAYGIPSNLAYQLLAVLNAGSSIGRYFPGLMADRIGRFNAIIITSLLCSVFTLAMWLPAQGNRALFITYLVVFGISSGSGISLTPVCVGQLCKTENLGRYYATCYTVASFATLTGIPISGSIIGNRSQVHKGNWSGLILFVGCNYLAALVCFAAARVRGVGWKLSKRY